MPGQVVRSRGKHAEEHGGPKHVQFGAQRVLQPHQRLGNRRFELHRQFTVHQRRGHDFTEAARGQVQGHLFLEALRAELGPHHRRKHQLFRQRDPIIPVDAEHLLHQVGLPVHVHPVTGHGHRHAFPIARCDAAVQQFQHPHHIVRRHGGTA